MIIIPQVIWDRMLEEFVQGRAEVEQVCFFDGMAIDTQGAMMVVTTLTFPQARLEAGRFEVSAENMSQAGKHLRKYRLRRLAQVHTHPTAWVGHSPWDDEKAYSTAEGSISIVLPDYARNYPTFDEAGVHFRTQAGWRQMSRGEIESGFRVVPSLCDFRPKQESKNDEYIEPARRRPWWQAFCFWQR